MRAYFLNKSKKVKIISKGFPGQILIVGIIFMAVILVLSAALFARVTNYIRFNSNDITREQATNLAEAGLEKALWQLNQTAGAYSGESDTALGTTGTFEVAVANKTSSLKTLTVTGYVPNKANPRSKRTIKIDAAIDTNQISFVYAVLTGSGGLNMENSSRINDGSIYTNGSITGSGSTVIEGDAWAVGTISSPDPLVQGTKHPGAPTVDMPTIDSQSWKDAAVAGGTTTCSGGTCTYSSGNTPLGPQKLVGDLMMQNSGELTINGPIWVTGNITVKNTAKIILNNSFGSLGTVIIADGKISTENSGAFVPTSANPKGYILAVSESTANDAILIKNSGANAIFYALSGGASLENLAGVTALVANRLETKNSATLTYDEGLAGGEYSAGPGGSWILRKGSYRFTQ